MSYSLDELKSLDSFVQSFYSAISLAPEKQIDFSRLRAHFLDNAAIIITNDSDADILTIDQFIENYQQQLSKGDLQLFEEQELARRTDTLGRMAHIFSTYESHHRSSDGERSDLGVMSMQLLREHERYFIASLIWLVGVDPDSLPDDLKPGDFRT